VVLADETSFTVVPLVDGERVYVADLELDRRTLRRWLRAHRIQHQDRVMVRDFRGKVASFDVLDDARRRAWSTYLADHNVKIVILDPLAALLGAYGYDENDNTGIGRLLAALDALKADAGITELMVIHHMGHAGERSRGASRLRDWPDAEWRLVRERPDNPHEEPPPDAARFFAAEGRDVAMRETKLDYDHETRRLTIAGGNRVQHKATRDMPAALKIIIDKPGLNGKELEARGKFVAGSRDRLRAAITALIEAGKVRTDPGPNNATLHYPSANQNGADDG
jgi:AAA domain